MKLSEHHRWPVHWYYDKTRIRCIVPACGFVTSSLWERQQYTEINNHCLTEMDKQYFTTRAEHHLLHFILDQRMCAINNCRRHFIDNPQNVGIRKLFKHEWETHRSAEMSNICSFVRLAREGRLLRHLGPALVELDPNCVEVAYYRMMFKIWALPTADLFMLFERNGCHQHSQQNSENLGRILTYDPWAEEGGSRPFWWPVKPEYFLSHCCPNSFNPADSWARLWMDLREKYADGRI